MTIFKDMLYSYESIPSKIVGTIVTIEVIAREHMGDLESYVFFFVQTEGWDSQHNIIYRRKGLYTDVK